jgi:hypothetical protein
LIAVAALLPIPLKAAGIVLPHVPIHCHTLESGLHFLTNLHRDPTAQEIADALNLYSHDVRWLPDNEESPAPAVHSCLTDVRLEKIVFSFGRDGAEEIFSPTLFFSPEESSCVTAERIIAHAPRMSHYINVGHEHVTREYFPNLIVLGSPDHVSLFSVSGEFSDGCLIQLNLRVYPLGD